MNKNLIAFILTLIIVGCNSNDNNIYSSSDFLVSKVYNYQNELIAEYEYNDSYQIIKGIYYHEENNIIEYVIFNYQNGILVNTKTNYSDLPEYYSESSNYYYDADEKLIEIENSYGNGQIFRYKLKYDSNSRFSDLCRNDDSIISHYEYDEKLNIIKKTEFLEDLTTGENFERTSEYLYDNFNKPSFGINSFTFNNLLPLSLTSNYLISFSKNNITFDSLNDIQYTYEYNEFNLPISIRPREGENYLNEKLIKIEYIKK